MRPRRYVAQVPKSDDPPITVTQVARQTGIPKRTIQLALANGEIKAHKLFGRTGAWIIDRAGLDAWLADRRAHCTRCGGTP